MTYIFKKIINKTDSLKIHNAVSCIKAIIIFFILTTKTVNVSWQFYKLKRIIQSILYAPSSTVEKVYINGLPRSMVTLLNVSLILLKTVLMFRNIKTWHFSSCKVNYAKAPMDTLMTTGLIQRLKQCFQVTRLKWILNFN